MPRRFLNSLSTVLLLILVILAWIFFLPIQFGGTTAYVIVNGQSMEPLYHRGDLVIVRREGAYTVGDIVTYHSHQLGQHVIHRIVAIQNETYTFKGDNNLWIDSEKPTFDQLVGRTWIRIPSVGKWLAPFQTPLGLSLLAGAAGLVIILALTPGKPRRLARRRNHPVHSIDGGAVMKELARQLETTLIVLSVVFILFLALGMVALSRDEYLTNDVATQYVHLGRFSYTAASGPGIYDAGAAGTGDPIFLKTSCQVSLRYDYSLMSEEAQAVSGDITLVAQAEANNGWKRTFPLVSKTSFSGKQAQVQSEIDPCAILATLRQVESKTELRRDIYSLVIIPEVNLAATISTQAVDSQFAPRLVFYLDDLQMYTLREDPENNPLMPIKVEEVLTHSRVPNMIHLPGFAVTVSLARLVAGLGLLAVLTVGAFLWYSLSRSMQADPLGAIGIKFGALIVSGTEAFSTTPGREVTVRAMEDLARVAERSGALIVHLHHAEADEFVVEFDDCRYRFALQKGSGHVAA